MNATLHHLTHPETHPETSSSVGPLPSFFLFVCIVGLAVTAMVTLKRKRAAAGDRPDGERKPLVSQTPSAAPTTRPTDGFFYQDY
jgi:hypothetical protein